MDVNGESRLPSGQLPDKDDNGRLMMTDVQKRHNENCYLARLSRSTHAAQRKLCLELTLTTEEAERFWNVGADIDRFATIKKSLPAIPASGLTATAGSGWELKLADEHGDWRARGYDSYGGKGLPSCIRLQCGDHTTKVVAHDSNCTVL